MQHLTVLFPVDVVAAVETDEKLVRVARQAQLARQRAGLEFSEAPGRILAQANLPDLAVPYLEALLEARSPYSTQTMKLDPMLDPIREHPAFLELIERSGGGG